MGWAIRREDGTYRSWSRNDIPSAIAAGEVLEELENCPSITSVIDKDAEALQDVGQNKTLQAAVAYFYNELNTIRDKVGLPPLDINVIKQGISDTYKALI